MEKEVYIAACVFTRNREEMIRDVLKYEIDLYNANSIDILYFDSSDGDITENIVKEYKDKGYNNLYYFSCKEINNLEQKISYAIKLLGKWERKKYDYFVVSNDSISIRRFFIPSILDKLKTVKPDLLILPNDNIYGRLKYTDNFYEDIFFDSPLALAKKSYIDMTLFGSTIIKLDIFQNADWEELDKLYVDIEKPNHYFCYITLILHQSMNISDFKGYWMGSAYRWAKFSTLKGNIGQYWYTRVMEIFCEGLIDSIKVLPDYYNPIKENLLKDIMVAYFNRDKIMSYVENGVIDNASLESNRSYMEKYNPVNYNDIVNMIGKGKSINSSTKEIDYLSCISDQMIEKLVSDTIEKSNNNEIIVFGAGDVSGLVLIRMLQKKVKLYCVAVSNKGMAPTSIRGVEVRSIYEIENTNSIIAIAAYPQYNLEIKKLLLNLNFKNIIVMEE